MSDTQILKEIAEELDFEGWSMYADEIREAAEEIQILSDVIDEQENRLKALLVPAEKATGKEGSTAVLTYIARLEEEIQRLRELIAFALEGLDSAPRSWGLKITHSDHIRKNMERAGMEPLAKQEAEQ